MPQPLSRVRKLTKAPEGGPLVILERPALAPYIIAVIHFWSHTEIALAQILSEMLHTESSVAMHMYLGLNGGAQRREALKTAAERSLSTENFALFTVMMKAIKSTRERRNDFAHGIWRIAEELPDALLWHSADADAEQFEKAIKREFVDLDTLVYRQQDFTTCLQDAEEALKLVINASVILSPMRNDEAKALARRRLEALPLLSKHGGLPPQ